MAAFLLPNLVIVLMHRLARKTSPEASRRVRVKNFAEVDDRLWRGATPTVENIETLAAYGVTTVVDLRAEKDIETCDALRSRVGITSVHLPLRDGQAPTREQAERFLSVVNESLGRVFVHCGAGVGRTGTMSAAYLVGMGRATRAEAVKRNLAVGPPRWSNWPSLSCSPAVRSVARRRRWWPTAGPSTAPAASG